jgi:hypothetical protein
MQSRFANRRHVIGGWRLGKQGLPNFGNRLPIETTSYTGKKSSNMFGKGGLSTKSDKFHYYPYCSSKDILLYTKFTLYLSS